MSLGTSIRSVLALFLLALVCGCSTDRKAPDASPHGTNIGVDAGSRIDDCKANRRKCNFEGAYEPKERDYAEQQAKRLNRAALERFRRSSGK